MVSFRIFNFNWLAKKLLREKPTNHLFISFAGGVLFPAPPNNGIALYDPSFIGYWDRFQEYDRGK